MEKGDFFRNMLYLRFRAATVACGACPSFLQPLRR
jgi:hypothetical protein